MRWAPSSPSWRKRSEGLSRREVDAAVVDAVTVENEELQQEQEDEHEHEKGQGKAKKCVRISDEAHIHRELSTAECVMVIVMGATTSSAERRHHILQMRQTTAARAGIPTRS